MFLARSRFLPQLFAFVAATSTLVAGQPSSSAGDARASGRVVLISLDGLGTRLFLDDPVTDELHALRALRGRGVMAEGLVPHMPSTTANTHAALWTGAWGDVNGIASNDMPLTPRASRRLAQRVSGYRSEGLRAEPIWVAAARQGVSTVAQQATQVYPLTPRVTGGDLPHPPTLVHGYQAPVVAPARWLQASDLTRVACGKTGTDGGTCFTWPAGRLTFTGALSADAAGRVSLRVGLTGSSRSVLVPAAATEHEQPRGRELARHFSDGLLVDVPGVPPVMAYFRLFEASPDGSSIVLFQSVLQEVVHHPAATRADAIAWLEAAGGFVGNGEDEPWNTPGISGTALWHGGDGTRERRYLETLELGIRQTIRHARYLWQQQSPGFFVGYVSMPDEMDHAWLGQARQDPRYATWRRWGYQLVDRAVEAYVGLTGPTDHIVFVSDHGMSPVTHEVRVNQVLRDAGLVAVDAQGRVDEQRSQVAFGRNCLFVHTTEWRGGVVPPSRRESVVAAASTALCAINDPRDGQPVVTAVLSSEADRVRFGFGGPNGYDACVDVRPGYLLSTRLDAGPVVRPVARPTGEHGFLPTRPDMHGILIAGGPRLERGGVWPLQRAIDVAPLVADLLGIAPPRDARGRSPLRPNRP